MVLLSPVLWPWEGHLLHYNRSLKAKIRRINRYGTEALALNLSLLLLPGNIDQSIYGRNLPLSLSSALLLY